ncbi:hypothetical protein [Flavobacterium filum]|uniref:hypothetical protein n=1 Tax=Flavobacterium filum TaxID=370974 RepID=UPI0023F1D864|nr:hypothetical protein [Flavobacterium filum]
MATLNNFKVVSKYSVFTYERNIKLVEKCIKKNDINILLSNCLVGTGGTVTWYYNEFDVLNGYVYFFIDNGEVVYIGASHRRGRMQEHKNKVRDYKCFYLPCMEGEYLDIETDLIRAFTTRYNCDNIAKKANKTKNNPQFLTKENLCKLKS